MECRGPRWIEADIDMDSSGVANHVVALVKGVTTSQTIDMAVVLQVTLVPALAPAQLCSIMRLPSVGQRDKSTCVLSAMTAICFAIVSCCHADSAGIVLHANCLLSTLFELGTQNNWQGDSS